MAGTGKPPARSQIKENKDPRKGCALVSGEQGVLWQVEGLEEPRESSVGSPIPHPRCPRPSLSEGIVFKGWVWQEKPFPAQP